MWILPPLTVKRSSRRVCCCQIAQLCLHWNFVRAQKSADCFQLLGGELLRPPPLRPWGRAALRRASVRSRIKLGTLKLSECGEDLEHQLGVGETVSIFSVIVTGLDLD